MTIAEQDHEILGGRYALEHLIATGGMGEVWRGRDLRLGRPVAVKILRSEYADDPGFAARFRAEATHAAALSHPNIAAVHDYGETTSRATGERIAYLVMELVEGAPLSALLSDEGPLEPAAALSVLRQAASALAEAHRAGLVHRDVKPANILIDPDGHVKLTDFGIAWSAASVPLTRTGQVIGTPQYMSPEQASGEAPRPASDVYALGLVGYETLAGHAAFDGDNPVTIALKQVQQDPDPLPAELPAEVRSLIDAALEKDPDARIPDGNALLSAIDETLDGRTPEVGSGTRALPVAAGTNAYPVAVTETADPNGGPRTAGTATADPFRPGSRHRRWLVIVAGLAVLLGGGGAAVALWGSDRAPVDSAQAGLPEAGAIVLAADDYVGRPADEVADELTALGLTVERLDRVTAERAPGTVAALDPVGTGLSAGDDVRLHVAVAPLAVLRIRGAGAARPGRGRRSPSRRLPIPPPRRPHPHPHPHPLPADRGRSTSRPARRRPVRRRPAWEPARAGHAGRSRDRAVDRALDRALDRAGDRSRRVDCALDRAGDRSRRVDRAGDRSRRRGRGRGAGTLLTHGGRRGTAPSSPSADEPAGGTPDSAAPGPSSPAGQTTPDPGPAA
ncbi:protein kinase domain-containing protein [Blastococcus brunescens]|uniref:non-specific serine/threonine protein kinase n=1 Tax=Blastococcus brunescens TaxID=1564165 RepID=A0ABZ1BAM5_9ACTN|nr:protein kinase [Blastococcus sp. BMG 8361]WRL66619.1 protein kinase [Blastococcus sp. BMG 8361]